MNKFVIILFSIICLTTACSKSGFNTVTNSSKTGSLASFNILNNFLLLADGSELYSYDISQGPKPVYKASFNSQNNLIETVFVLDDKIFLGTQNAMLILALSPSGEPELIGTASHIRSCDPVVVKDNIAYVTTRSGSDCRGGQNTLFVYDVENIHSPKLLTELDMTQPMGLATNGDILYVCDLVDGIMVLDISDPKNTHIINKVNAKFPKDIIILNEEEMLVLNEEYISFYDIRTSSHPSLKYKYE